jgi:hypothetical protein
VPLPTFFVTGAPQTGSTALRRALTGHPHLFLSDVAEPGHFLTDGPPPELDDPGKVGTAQEYVWRPEDYTALFAAAPDGVPRGESSSLYLWSRAAHLRIAEQIPAAKFVVVLRDPIARAHASWAQLRSTDLEVHDDLVEACYREGERIAAGWSPMWRYIELGRYGSQVASLYEKFGSEQVLLLRYRDLVDAPASTLDRVCRFLGVAEGVVDRVPWEGEPTTVEPAAVPDPAPLQRRLSLVGPLLRRRTPRPLEPLGSRNRNLLLPLFRDDIDHLQELTGLDLTSWLTAAGPELGEQAA